MSSALTRVIRTEGFRLDSIFAVFSALSVTVFGIAACLYTTHALRDQVAH